MLSWLFKKSGDAPSPQAPAVPQAAAQAQAASKALQVESDKALWQPRLQAAQGDDVALLAVAQAAPLLEIKLAAVEALASEAVLKQAERAFRSHDRKVHQVAKRRLEAAVALREARASAQLLIAAAGALAAEVPLPANRLVALDRDWQAIDANLLTPEQGAEFLSLRERLNTLLREQGEQQQRQQHEEQRLRAEAALARAEEEARRAAEAAAQPAPEPDPLPEPAAAAPTPPVPKPTLSPEQRQQLTALLTQAEAALAEGQLGEMQQQLQAIDAAVAALNGVALSDSLRARHQALHAERARLKAWQQWGGARALDTLVAEAEALAQLTLAAADPQAAEAPKQAPKLRIKPHADSIQALRARWKEIDRTGAPSNQALWQRFDAALHTAYLPVAAQQAAVKAARQENLQAREALLATLDAVPAGEPPANADELAAHWKEQLRALTGFQLAWRQLGPLEHTVPSGARNGLHERLRGSVERIEAPLNEARRVAGLERENLIARAEALVAELNRQPGLRDASLRVRELQAEWQQHARTLPLARAVEGALWARFKAATDAVFAQREAAFTARDAELSANLAAREALLASLAAIDLQATPVAEMQRALNDADRAWRQPVEVPRAAVQSIESRFLEARAALAQAVAESANKRWHAECDALAGKLALCEERESATTDATELAGRWAAQPALPAAWDQALSQRWSQPIEPGPGPLGETACDELLLQLEAAFDVPSAPEWQAARRELKLRALKDALEGRAPKSPAPAQQRAQWFAAALLQRGLSAAQRERLHALITALRQAPPAPQQPVSGAR